MVVLQTTVRLAPRARGFHIVTDEIERAVDGLESIRRGLAHIFIQHTSASLTINENADPDVRHDFETHFRRSVPEDTSLYRHTLEGPDDMTSHIKASTLGSSVSIPVTNGRFNLGTWQGIYLGEHRDHARSRTLIITVIGEQ